MLIYGSIAIQDMNAGPNAAPPRALRSCLMTKKLSGNRYMVCVKNSKYPNSISYRLTNLAQLYTKFVAEGKLSMEFRKPRHTVMVHADDADMLAMLLTQVRDIVSGKDVMIGARPMPKTLSKRNGQKHNPFDPENTEYVAIERFDRRVLNMLNLNYLVMENCHLPNLPAHIGRLPIAYLSLSNSRLGESQNDRDTLWDWMTEDTICGTLNSLKMEAVGLQTLPFEITYLKNLHTLSIAKNNLTYLPQYIGELKKLLSLSVADNSLNYFPDSLFCRTFSELNISNNPFIESETESLLFDHVSIYNSQIHNQSNERLEFKSVVRSLSNLSLNTLMEHKVKFRRQDIPRSIWHYFNVAGCCVHCQKFMLPQYLVACHILGFPAARYLVKNQATVYLQWQSLKCRFKCSKK